MSVFTEAQIQALAQELHQSEKTRVQIEHFSKRFPGMTLCGEGDLVKTLLLPGQLPYGQEIK